MLTNSAVVTHSLALPINASSAKSAIQGLSFGQKKINAEGRFQNAVVQKFLLIVQTRKTRRFASNANMENMPRTANALNRNAQVRMNTWVTENNVTHAKIARLDLCQMTERPSASNKSAISTNNLWNCALIDLIAFVTRDTFLKTMERQSK